jgi:hypothetical protein
MSFNRFVKRCALALVRITAWETIEKLFGGFGTPPKQNRNNKAKR